MRRLSSFILAALSAAPAGAAAVEWVPVLNAELYGGYSYFSGERMEGPNGSFLFVPGVSFGGKVSLLPVLSADYQKSRDVQELAGGGFLTQAQHARQASLRTIWKAAPDWKLKAYASYKQQFIKSANNEAWGEGLFDYEKPGFGVESAWEGGSFLRSSRVGLDVYDTRFPNFQSLASGSALGAEIGAGRDVLNFRAVDLPVGVELGIGKNSLDLKALASFRRFPDQKVVHDDGNYGGTRRRDLYGLISADVRRPLPRLGKIESLASFTLSHGRLSSNQNNVTVSNFVQDFNPDYYSYQETIAGPSFQARFFGHLTAGVGYLMTYRVYDNRPALTDAGADRGSPIYTRAQTLRWSAAYPVMKGLSVRFQGATQHQDSNMKSETAYRYNYSSAHYFLGVGWEI
jgi:hypothetical protein